MAKAKHYKVIWNEELRELAKHFVPVFGSAEDLSIVDRLLDLEKKLPLVDNDALRNPKKGAKQSAKMQEILREERNLIASITRRNNDF